jgi:hypothetical protein
MGTRFYSRTQLATAPKSFSGTKGAYALVSQRKLAIYLAHSTFAGVANDFKYLVQFVLAKYVAYVA